MRQRGSRRGWSWVLVIAMAQGPALPVARAQSQGAQPKEGPSEPSMPKVAPTPGPEPAPPPAPPDVKVNRTVPKVEPVPAYPIFSEDPTEQEIFRARVFGEPLVPVGGSPSAEENQDLAKAVTAFLRKPGENRFAFLTSYLEEHPSTVWRASLLANLGILYRQKAYFTRAEKALREAWDLAKGAQGRNERAVADRALRELLDLHMNFGQVDPLQELLDDAKGRDLLGGTAVAVEHAKAGVWGLLNQHEWAIPSGPVALARIREHRQPGIAPHPDITAFHATPDGATLLEMRDLAQQAGMKLRLARRQPGAKIPVPSLMHLNREHFSAVVGQQGEDYFLDDPLLGGEVRMSRAALEEESSGLFLVPEGRLPEGWTVPEEEAAARVRGKCKWPTPERGQSGDPNTTMGGGSGGGGNPGGPGGGCSGGKCGCEGLAGYTFHTLLASIHIEDIPVGYSPPRGPAVQFRAVYNHREAFQPTIFTFSNLGPQWNFDWVSYLEDDPSNPGGTSYLVGTYLFPRGGGRRWLSGYDGQSFAPDRDDQSVVTLVSSSPVRYERRMTDGSKEVFTASDGAMTAPRRTFLTEGVWISYWTFRPEWDRTGCGTSA